MRIPVIEGIIRRRLLVNYRVDPRVIRRHLPSRFRPKLQDGQAIVGICLIRLEHIRPRRLPQTLGLHSENAAHRIAVWWDDEDGHEKEGVFVARRDTDSWLNHRLGGRVFPGEHHLATFDATDAGTSLRLSMRSRDQAVAIDVEGRASDRLPANSVFRSLSESRRFFEAGSLGYSVTRDPRRLDGIVLVTRDWTVCPFEIEHVYSNYFADAARFPPGSIEFDHALLIRDLEHEWHSANDLHV